MPLHGTCLQAVAITALGDWAFTPLHKPLKSRSNQEAAAIRRLGRQASSAFLTDRLTLAQAADMLHTAYTYTHARAGTP
jgi:hypothetical protein